MNLDFFLKKAHSAYFYYLPKPLWVIINPFVESVIRKLRMNNYDSKLSTLGIIRLSGNAIASREPLNVTVFGNEFEANYYSKLFFESVEKKEILNEKVLFAKLNEEIQKEKSWADIIAIHASEKHCARFWNEGFVVLPDEVRQEMELPKDFSVIESRMRKILKTFPIFRELERITVERSTNPNDLNIFIEKMYHPTIKKRFDDAGFIYPTEELEFFYKKGALFFVKNDGLPKAGMILAPQKDTLNAIAIGAYEGDNSILRTGYLPLMYLEALRYAHANKYSIMNFGGSKTFLMDGVLRFKKDVGTKVHPSNTQPVINAFLFPKKQSITAWQVISKNSFIAIKNNKLHGVSVFTQQNPPLKEVMHARRIALIPGLDKIAIIAPEFTDEVRAFYKNDKQVVLIEESDFSAYSKRIGESI